MDFIFRKNKNNKSLKKKILVQKVKKKNQFNNVSSINNNYTHIFFIINQLFLRNGSLLKIFSNYIKVLRKSLLPWYYTIQLVNSMGVKNIFLTIKPMSIRNKIIFKNLIKSSIYVNILYRWVSPYYRVRRIKRWLSKKYTNKLWR